MGPNARSALRALLLTSVVRIPGQKSVSSEADPAYFSLPERVLEQQLLKRGNLLYQAGPTMAARQRPPMQELWLPSLLRMIL